MQTRFIGIAIVLAACFMPVAHALDPKDSPQSAVEGGKAAGQYIEDVMLTSKVKAVLFTDSVTSAFEIGVSSDKGIVTLNGNVDRPEAIDRAIRLAIAVPGVRRVDAQLGLKPTT